jgi:hypothetical protein
MDVDEEGPLYIETEHGFRLNVAALKARNPGKEKEELRIMSGVATGGAHPVCRNRHGKRSPAVRTQGCL